MNNFAFKSNFKTSTEFLTFNFSSVASKMEASDQNRSLAHCIVVVCNQKCAMCCLSVVLPPPRYNFRDDVSVYGFRTILPKYTVQVLQTF